MAHPLDCYKSSWKDIEDYDKVYLITWNPKPRFYNYSIFGENDYNVQWRTMLKVLLEANRCCSRFAFVPEISDEGKLHMHGWFVVSDRIKYHKSFLPSLNRGGFIKKSKAKKHTWDVFKYHVKEVDITQEYLNQHENIVVTHENCKAIRAEMHLYLALIEHNYNNKKAVKKQNVMKMLENYLLEDSLD